MHSTHINDGQGEEFAEPFRRTIKHLHTPWGTGATFLWAGMSEVPAGSQSNPHAHNEQEESFFIHEGEGEVVVDGRAISVRAGSLVVISPGEVHQLRNTGSALLRVFCVVAPPFAEEQFSNVHEPSDENVASEN